MGTMYSIFSLFFRDTLDQDERTNVILVGVGNLGTALLQYNFSKNNSTVMTHAFDVDEKKIGTTIGDVPIYDWNKLEEAGIKDTSIAVLTVPASQAQSSADKLVEAGISGILNFTPVRLSVPEHIRVHHIDLAIELQALVYF